MKYLAASFTIVLVLLLASASLAADDCPGFDVCEPQSQNPTFTPAPTQPPATAYPGPVETIAPYPAPQQAQPEPMRIAPPTRHGRGRK